MNRRGQIGPMGAALLLAASGGLLGLDSVVREAQRREEERVRERMLRAQGIDPAAIGRGFYRELNKPSRLMQALSEVERPRAPVFDEMVLLPKKRSLAERKARRAKRKQRRNR